MLSRLVSDTWLEDPESEVFIDRDGDRFAYILDYLRYGELKLPISISFDLFMKDVDYFGIHVVQGSVTRENFYPSKTLNELVDAEKERKHMLLAIDIMKDYTEHSKTTISKCIDKRGHYSHHSICGKNVCQTNYDEKLLNSCLAKFGFKVSGWVVYRGTCTLRVLD